jgi:formyltetrahydrofolate deformylase
MRISTRITIWGCFSCGWSGLLLACQKAHWAWKAELLSHRKWVALFCSQYLHCMADLLHRWRAGELRCDIPLIVSNHRDVEGLAEFYGVPFEFVQVTGGRREEAEAHQLEVLESKGIELVVLARYMQILSPAFVAGTRRRSSTCTTRFCRRLRGPSPTTRHMRGG